MHVRLPSWCTLLLTYRTIMRSTPGRAERIAVHISPLHQKQQWWMMDGSHPTRTANCATRLDALDTRQVSEWFQAPSGFQAGSACTITAEDPLACLVLPLTLSRQHLQGVFCAEICFERMWENRPASSHTLHSY